MKFKFFLFVMLGVILSIAVPAIVAQAPSKSCTSVVQKAYNDLGTNCANMPENSLCYGSSKVKVQPVNENVVLAFDNPADRVSLPQISSVKTSDLNLTDDEWGIAVYRTRANLPLTLNGQGLVMLTFGDMELVDKVPDALAYYPEVAVRVTVQSASLASLMSFPPNWGNRQSVEVGTIVNGTALTVDAISADGQWLRAQFRYDPTNFTSRATAWININNIDTTTVDLSQVAVMTPQSRTPMQSFTFMNSANEPQCADQLRAELMIQGPSTIESEVTMFDLDVRISSTITAYLIPRDACRYDLRLIPITSYLMLPDPTEPDNIDKAIIVEAGQYIDIPLLDCNENGTLVLDPDWLSNFPQQKSVFESNLAQGGNYLSLALTDELSRFKFIPSNILNYPIDQTPILISFSSAGNPIPIFEAFIPRPRS